MAPRNGGHFFYYDFDVRAAVRGRLRRQRTDLWYNVLVDF